MSGLYHHIHSVEVHKYTLHYITHSRYVQHFHKMCVFTRYLLPPNL